jgi:large subunit ribosomal protein LP0
MDVPTKITKGQIEIVRDVPLVQMGDKVSVGQADLLQKLGIKPFTYGLDVRLVFNDGQVFSPAVLSISDGDIIAAFTSGARNIAALSFAIGIANHATVPHSIRAAVRAMISVVINDGATYSFAAASEVKAYLADPSAFAAANPSGGGGGGGDAPAAPKAPEPEPEPEPEEEVVVSFGDSGGGGDAAW